MKTLALLVSISAVLASSWARGGNFLTRNITVKRAGNVTLEGWQIIGWDPVNERIRSWAFDGEGGFSDGNRTSADNTFTKLAADRFTWESTNRALNGEPQPGIGRIEVHRVKAT